MKRKGGSIGGSARGLGGLLATGLARDLKGLLGLAGGFGATMGLKGAIFLVLGLAASELTGLGGLGGLKGTILLVFMYSISSSDVHGV